MFKFFILTLLINLPFSPQQNPKPNNPPKQQQSAGPPAPNTSSPTSNPSPKPAPKPKTLPPMRHHWEVAPRNMMRPTKHILFLFDSSGSMKGNRISAAIEFVLSRRNGVAAAPFDDFYIALATFGSGFARWEGTDDMNPATKESMSKYGWSAMPSADNLKAARQWITTHLDGGSTNFVPGLTHCFTSNSGIKQNLASLKRAVSIDELTILVITDGNFHDGLKNSADALKRLQKQRRDNNLAEAIIGFIGIEVNVPDSPDEKPSGGHATLLSLAKEYGHLGYLRIEFVHDDENENK